MAQNYSEIAILEGNDNCIPVRLNGIIVDVPQHYFNTNLYNVKDVIDHDNDNLLNGIAEHFENEGLMVGDDGFVYASIDPDDTTLSGDDYEPIGLLDGEDLELAGFKFKMPKLKMPGKKKSGKGQLIKTKNPMLRSVGNLATKGFRTFNPIGMMGKKGLIGRNLGKLKNPFKKIKLGKFKNPFKGGKGGKGASAMMDTLTQLQEAQSQQQEEELQEEIVEESSDTQEDSSDSSQTDYSEDSTNSDTQEDSSDSSQTDYSEDSTNSDTQEDYSEDSQEVNGSSDMAFSAASTALSFIPGGSIASGLLNTGKGMYDQQQASRSAGKQAVTQQRIALLKNLIKSNPKKKVVVVKKKPVTPQLIKQSPQPPQIKQNNFSSTTPRLKAAQETDYQPTQKKDNSMMIGLGIAALAVGAIAMSGKE
jgi:hypothetical protein